MCKTLVTGASGFVGWHVAQRLLRAGHRLRLLVRDPSKVFDLEAEIVPGDLTAPASVREAARGCRYVFHVAADYRLWSRHPEEIYASNVQGTRNLLEAASAAGAERIIYTSTVGCIGIPPDGLGDETVAVSEGDMSGAYKRSKFQAEQLVLDYARRGLPVVIVNPTAPVGERDVKPTPTGRLVLDYLRGRMPAFIDTGLNLVDVRDVAEGHLLALQRGRPGERYILGARNMTLREILDTLDEITGQRQRRVRIPYALALAAGYFNSTWAWFSGQTPQAPLEAVRMARKKMFVRHEKAARELGYAPADPTNALRRAVDWFRAHGYV